MAHPSTSWYLYPPCIICPPGNESYTSPWKRKIIDSKVPAGIGHVSFRGYPKIHWTLWGHWGGNPRFQTIPPSHSRMTPKVSAMRRPQSLPPWQVRQVEGTQAMVPTMTGYKSHWWWWFPWRWCWWFSWLLMLIVSWLMVVWWIFDDSDIFAWFPDTCHTWWEIFRWTAAFNFWWHAFFWQPKTIKNETCGDQLQAMESQRTCKPEMNKG